MTYAHHTVTLSGPDGYGQRMPPDRLGTLLTELTPTARRTIRMRFEGRSTARGRRADWLRAASDIRLVDYVGGDVAVLHFEAPRLGEAVPQLYEQRELWPSRPAPESTAFDLLAVVIGDIAQNNRDSEFFDRPLLRQFQRLGKAFDHHMNRLTLGELHAGAPAAAVDRELLAMAQALWRSTPVPRRVRVVGRLDMLWESRQSFSLCLAGEPNEVRGVLADGEIRALKHLFGQQVVVEGRAVYRPSGRVLRIDAERVAASPGAARIWERVPSALASGALTGRVRVRQTPRTGVNAIIGQWPGDETDEQVEQVLEQMS